MSVSALDVAACDARGDAGENFPDDGACLVGDFGDGELGAEELDFLAFGDFRVGGDIDHHLVHGDAAEDGEAVAADPNDGSLAGNLAWVAIAVADADGCDAGGLGGDEGAAVGNAVACGEGADECDARF